MIGDFVASFTALFLFGIPNSKIKKSKGKIFAPYIRVNSFSCEKMEFIGCNYKEECSVIPDGDSGVGVAFTAQLRPQASFPVSNYELVSERISSPSFGIVWQVWVIAVMLSTSNCRGFEWHLPETVKDVDNSDSPHNNRSKCINE